MTSYRQEGIYFKIYAPVANLKFPPFSYTSPAQIDTTLNPENPYEKIAQLKEALQRAEQQNRALKEALANKQSITYAFIHPSDAA